MYLCVCLLVCLRVCLFLCLLVYVVYFFWQGSKSFVRAGRREGGRGDKDCRYERCSWHNLLPVVVDTAAISYQDPFLLVSSHRNRARARRYKINVSWVCG